METDSGLQVEDAAAARVLLQGIHLDWQEG
jgi:hypothetical protein